MPTQEELPEEGEYVAFEFEGEHERQSPIKGRVVDVDTDPVGTGVELEIVIDEGNPNQTVSYSEGEHDGEELRVVDRYDEFNGHFHLGENASWRRLE